MAKKKQPMSGMMMPNMDMSSMMGKGAVKKKLKAKGKKKK